MRPRRESWNREEEVALILRLVHQLLTMLGIPHEVVMVMDLDTEVVRIRSIRIKRR